MSILRWTTSLSLFFLFSFCALSQETEKKEREAESGRLSLGMRNTLSAFGNGGYPGTGIGGQFRLQIGKNLNTEWFADYITTDFGGVGKRVDAHIGWSVMFYPFNTDYSKARFNPYFVAGHCFDYTRLNANPAMVSSGPFPWIYPGDRDERWSSAVQMGIGSSYQLSDNFDITLVAQYMSHLGNDVHGEVVDIGDKRILVIDEHRHGLTLEGHLLVTLSLNLMIADLWK